MDIVALIRIAKARGASDLHMTVASPSMLRIHGLLEPAEDNAGLLTPQDMQEAFSQLTSDQEKTEFHRDLELDFAYAVPDLVRVRCNAAMQRGTITLALRLIANSIPDIATLHIPDLCRDLILRPRGMLIVSGPTGSGKSTTLAAMIDYLNHKEKRRIVTIEDPIEYVYTSQKCNMV